MTFTHIDRYVSYRAVVGVSPETYEVTTTGDGVGYAFQFEKHRADLRDMAERALSDVPSATVDTVDVRPGYLSARVTVNEGRLKGAPTPKQILGALSGVAPTFNERTANPTPNGNGYLDGLYFGERYIEAVRPSDAPTPEEWIEAHCEPPADDDAPDASDDPIVFEAGDPHAWDAGAGRHFPITFVRPVLPVTYELQEAGRYDDTTWRFEWTEEEAEQLRIYIEPEGSRWGGEYRLAIHPHYVRLDTATPALNRAPIQSVLQDFDQLFNNFNLTRRAVVVGDMGREYRRPKVQFAETAYLGATDPDGHAEAWIDARDLDDVDGATFEPEPEPDPEDADADSDGKRGGLIGRLGGS